MDRMNIEGDNYKYYKDRTTQGVVIYAAKAHLFDLAGISFCRTRCCAELLNYSSNNGAKLKGQFKKYDSY